MYKLRQALTLIALATGILTMSACASLDATQAHSVPSAKLDNGLGELPHYRDWIDPTGREPMAPVQSAKVSR